MAHARLIGWGLTSVLEGLRVSPQKKPVPGYVTGWMRVVVHSDLAALRRSLSLRASPRLFRLRQPLATSPSCCRRSALLLPAKPHARCTATAIQ